MEKLEIELYDVTNRIDKWNSMKWTRFVNANEVIIFKFLLWNPLMNEVVISDLYLNCSFIPCVEKEDILESMLGVLPAGANITEEHKKITLKPWDTKEVLL